MDKCLKRLFVVFWVVMFSLPSFCQRNDRNERFFGREYRKGGDVLRYRVWFPPGYDADGLKFPLFIFLHGEDERGSDNVMQLKYGGKIYKEQTIQDYYPAVVLLPQCPEEDAWAYYNTLDDGEVEIPSNPDESRSSKVLRALIQHYLNKPYVDKSQVYIVGMANGAFGALDMVARYPRLFTAAVSMGGAIDAQRYAKLKKFPIRFFHGTDDRIVPIDKVREVNNQLKSNGCPSELVEYPGTGHDSWTIALSSSDFMEWIFSKKKK